MTTPLAAITADTHLRPSTWAKHPDLCRDAYIAFRQIIDYCIAESLPLFLLGDLFDKSRPDSASVAFYISAIARMEEAGLPVYYIDGNHDKSDPSWAAMAPWATHLHKQSVNIRGTNFYGLDYTFRDALPAELAAMPPDVDVLLTHQSWEDIQPIGHVDGSFTQIPYGVTLVTGDFHVSQSYEGLAADGGTVRAYSPGSTCMQKLNESPDKSMIVISDVRSEPGPDTLRIQATPLPSRPFHQQSLQNAEDFDRFILALPNLLQELQSPVVLSQPAEIHTPILKVTYDDTIPDAHARLAAAAAAFHLFPEPYHALLEHVVDVDATPAGAFDGLLAAVEELCTDEPAVYNGLQRLLEAATPATEIVKLFEEYQHSHAQSQSG